MRSKTPIEGSAHARRAGTVPSSLDLDAGEEINVRVHRAIDLLFALVTHAEAARRWIGRQNGPDHPACALARRLVADALRLGTHLRASGAFDRAENAALSRAPRTIGPLRDEAEQLLAHVQREGDGDVGLQDALHIVGIVRRLEASLRPWIRQPPAHLAATA
jgi:hypothetical protein